MDCELKREREGERSSQWKGGGGGGGGGEGKTVNCTNLLDSWNLSKFEFDDQVFGLEVPKQDKHTVHITVVYTNRSYSNYQGPLLGTGRRFWAS